MAKSLISTNISTQVLKFKPGGSPASFEVVVNNDSDQFATFQLEVIAAGADLNGAANWYSLSPEISSKKPPGDSTKFFISITDTPVPGFIGTMNLTIRVFSLELRDEERQLLRLFVEQGIDYIPLQIELPVREFQKPPNELVEIPVRVYNPTQLAADVVLSFMGVNPDWLVSGSERRLQIKPGTRAETSFLCQLPAITQTVARAHNFKIYCSQSSGFRATAEGVLKILPGGYVDFSCTPAVQQLPEPSRFPRWKSNSATYQLQFQNFGNLIHQCRVQVTPGEDQPKSEIEVLPETAYANPGESAQMQLVVSLRRHWWGWKKRLLFQVKAAESEQTLDVRNDTQLIKLSVLPVIPAWMQLAGGLLFLLILWWLSWLNPNNPFWGHKAAVTSVQFNGLGDRLVSGSNDQTLIKWNVRAFFNPFTNQDEGRAGEAAKSVRTVRFRPVDNDLLAAGLENGEIHLWNLLGDPKKPLNSFTYQKDDRVLALAFTQDSRYLFSGHGSGTVLQWNAENTLLRDPLDSSANPQIAGKKFDFAVYSLSLVGRDNQNLVIGGRFNQLVMWNWTSNRLRRILYRPGGQEDYIYSSSAAVYKPELMATSDNQGFITLWNMSQCLVKDVKCEVLDEWSDGHGGKAVRSVALSTNGCYLVSGGDDGRVMLWPLLPDGKRATQYLKGQKVGQFSKINSVDVKVVRQNILVASGSDDTQVRVRRMKHLPQLGCDQ